jgi:hypothetical protein
MWSPPKYKKYFSPGGAEYDAGLEKASNWILSNGGQQELNAVAKEKRPLLVVHNRFSDSVHDLLPAGRVPLMSASSIEYIFEECGKSHRIVYFGDVGNDERLSGYTPDSGNDVAIDFQRNIRIQKILNRYPEVVQFNQLFSQLDGSSHNYNRIQLAVHARASRFISVAGGSAVIASYFGGVNVIMTAHSIPFEAIGGFYSRFAGTRVVAVSTDEELMERVGEEYGLY